MKTKNIIKIVIGSILIFMTVQNSGSIFQSHDIGEATGSLLVKLLVTGLGVWLIYSGIKQHQNSTKE